MQQQKIRQKQKTKSQSLKPDKAFPMVELEEEMTFFFFKTSVHIYRTMERIDRHPCPEGPGPNNQPPTDLVGSLIVTCLVASAHDFSPLAGK
jgi:hypothetical protein